MQAELFQREPVRIDLVNADILYWPALFSGEESEQLLQQLVDALTWEQRQLRVFDKLHRTPRLVAWCADPGVSYTYSGDTAPRQEWPPQLQYIKQRVEATTHCHFNGALLNLYRDGDDSMGWHSDDEISLGSEPVIASLSLGAARTFQFRPKPPLKGERVDILLEPGSLLLMRGTTQQYWQHCLPRRKRVNTPRLNITFRLVSV